MEKMDYLNNTFKYREDFLKELQKIGIRKCHVFDRYKKKFVLKSLNGDEDLKVLIHLKLKVCFPYLEKVEQIQNIWDEFLSIYIGVKQNKIHYLDVKKRTADWLIEYRKVYPDDSLGLYMHIFDPNPNPNHYPNHKPNPNLKLTLILILTLNLTLTINHNPNSYLNTNPKPNSKPYPKP